MQPQSLFWSTPSAEEVQNYVLSAAQVVYLACRCFLVALCYGRWIRHICAKKGQFSAAVQNFGQINWKYCLVSNWSALNQFIFMSAVDVVKKSACCDMPANLSCATELHRYIYIFLQNFSRLQIVKALFSTKIYQECKLTPLQVSFSWSW